jgi:hypothetical protein
MHMSLWQDFQTNDDFTMLKWHHYFPIYEKHFSPWRNKTVTVLEIGIFKGGSLGMWRRFFGPLSTIIGIDIDPSCKQYQADGVHVRIGDQSDQSFLQSIIDEFGVIDVVIDDGSHHMDHVGKTFQFLYPLVSKNGHYVIEDLHTAYFEEYGGGINSDKSFINYSKKLIDDLNADHSRGAIEPNQFTRNTFGMSFYDSVIVFERGTMPIKGMVQTGRERLKLPDNLYEKFSR